MMKNANKGRTFLGGFLSVFGTGLLLILVGLAIALSVVPHLVNGAALTVLTGSMEPNLSPGDMIVVAGVDPSGSDVQAGDVITFMPYPDDPTLITHRVIGKAISPSQGVIFTTQGDANGAPDEPVLAKQVRGKMLYNVPYIGYFTQWASGQFPWLAGLGGAALVAYAVFGIVIRPRRRSATAPSAETAPAAAPAAEPLPKAEAPLAVSAGQALAGATTTQPHPFVMAPAPVATAVPRHFEVAPATASIAEPRHFVMAPTAASTAVPRRFEVAPATASTAVPRHFELAQDMLPAAAPRRAAAPRYAAEQLDHWAAPSADVPNDSFWIPASPAQTPVQLPISA
ncbi:MAG: signal peptidase I [Propionibacteriaceae bacterium]|jgi:signal peptidase|nr:signal peptidase I [Propionibacteriaceae bacterium]